MKIKNMVFILFLFSILNLTAQTIIDNNFWKPLDLLAKTTSIRVLVLKYDNITESVGYIEEQLLKRYIKNRNFVLIDRRTIEYSLAEIEKQYSELFDEEQRIRLGSFYGATHICFIIDDEIRLIDINTMEVVAISTLVKENNTNTVGLLRNINFNVDGNIRFGSRTDITNVDYEEIFTNINIGFGMKIFNTIDINLFTGLLYEQYLWHGTTGSDYPDSATVCYGIRSLIELKQIGVVFDLTYFDGLYLKEIVPSFGISINGIYGTISLMSNNSMLFGVGLSLGI